MEFSVDRKITFPLRIIGIIAAAVLLSFPVSKYLREEKFKPDRLNDFTTEQVQRAQDKESSFEYRLNALMPLDRNYVFSPLGVKLSLIIAANGTGGYTQKEILSALGYGNMNYANGIFRNTAKENADKLAVSGWINTDKGSALNRAYAWEMNRLYNAEISEVSNFNARGKINKWCEEHTNGLIPCAAAKSDFELLITSAVYFDEKWEQQFDGRSTHSGVFTQRDGKTAKTDFMHGEFIARYYEDEDVKILEKRYRDTHYAMYFVLSGDKRVDISKYLDKFKGEYDEEKFYGSDPDNMWYEVWADIPKFEINGAYSLVPALETVGIKCAFDKSKDAEQGFCIDEMLQSCIISVDEEGTVAAAVTETNAELAVSPGEKVKYFVADTPFTYCLADTNSREILFLGEFAYIK